MGYSVGNRLLLPAEVVEARDRGNIGLKVGSQIILLSEATLDAAQEAVQMTTVSAAAYGLVQAENDALKDQVRELLAEIEAQNREEVYGPVPKDLTEIAGVDPMLTGSSPVGYASGLKDQQAPTADA